MLEHPQFTDKYIQDQAAIVANGRKQLGEMPMSIRGIVERKANALREAKALAAEKKAKPAKAKAKKTKGAK